MQCWTIGNNIVQFISKKTGHVELQKTLFMFEGCVERVKVVDSKAN